MLIGQPEAQVWRGARDDAVADARVHAVSLGGMVESESGAGAGKGGRSSDGDGKNIPLQKHLPTSFAG